MKAGLITGASGAIGRAIALELAEEGYSLYLHFNKNASDIQMLKRQLEDTFPDQTFQVVQADFSSQNGVSDLLGALPKNQLDLIVHNSGHSDISLFQDVSEASLDAMIHHQIRSPFLMTQALIPYMIRQKSGRIIFISSIWGLTGAATEVTYSMAKGAQNSFCKALAKELAPSGITVNAIAPGAVNTSMLDYFEDSEIEVLKDEIPMGRFAEPQEIASLVRYLTQPNAAYITGQVLSVNGGWYC